MAESELTGKWVVDVKGGPDESHEISVLRDDNAHGKQSWGNPGESKIIIKDNGPLSRSYYGDLVLEHVWSSLLEIARETADELNQREAKSPGFRFIGPWYHSREVDGSMLGRALERAMAIIDAKRVARIMKTAEQYGKAHPAPPEFWDK